MTRCTPARAPPTDPAAGRETNCPGVIECHRPWFAGSHCGSAYGQVFPSRFWSELQHLFTSIIFSAVWPVLDRPNWQANPLLGGAADGAIVPHPPFRVDISTGPSAVGGAVLHGNGGGAGRLPGGHEGGLLSVSVNPADQHCWGGVDLQRLKQGPPPHRAGRLPADGFCCHAQAGPPRHQSHTENDQPLFCMARLHCRRVVQRLGVPVQQGHQVAGGS